eukprot:TRINITY_DN521_c6_g1_i2.p1 TRINITY_DN521_c6_g1~~TRINITY_DN521_c6_g1_i2.p1  ORF type:complete len:491 (-),score=163.98 TRINITY_DN521_c6_g1_i2:115-1587(-)
MEREEARRTSRFGGGGGSGSGFGGANSSDAQLRSLSDRHQKLLSKFNTLQKTHDSTKIMIAKKDEELMKWKSKFAMAQQVIRRQEHEHAKSLDAVRLESEERRATLVQEHIESEERLAKMLELSKEEIERYSQEVSNSHERSQRLERELSGVRAECDASHRNYKESRERIQSLEQQCAQFSKEIRSLKDTLLGERSSKMSMSVRLASAEDQVHEMNESLTAVQKELLDEKERMVQEYEQQSRLTARMGEWVCAIVRLTRVMLGGVSDTLSWHPTSWEHSVMHVLECLVGCRSSSERLLNEKESSDDDDCKPSFPRATEEEMEGAWHDVMAVARDELADLVLMEEEEEEEEPEAEEERKKKGKWGGYSSEKTAGRKDEKKKDWRFEVLLDLESLFSLRMALRTWRDEIYDDLVTCEANSSAHLTGDSSIMSASATEDHHSVHPESPEHPENHTHSEKQKKKVVFETQPTGMEPVEEKTEEVGEDTSDEEAL